MFKNKLFNMALIIMIGITLLGGVSFVLWKTTFAPTTGAAQEEVIEERKLTADELVEYMVTTDVITTNISPKGYIVVQFGILLDGKKAKAEFEKRNVQVRSIIISELASLTHADLEGSAGINRLEAILMNRFNEIMLDGKVQSIYTVDLKLQ
ncbi:flagellar basal body-associated FliL family protein [Caldalkalibacillus mannanilyticus]|uniref:flagellar basal body-associated FliL family protein n=1 Tax=Caldalkalibacillus mannanilyticus TaxID=1418 RepID=UPI000469A54E|nr:flagellar basal body-associated FliL family protein [Caldalkalibacillus mannanilyticus]